MSKGYAELILESLLKEEAMQADVIDAIKKRYEVGINYVSDKTSKGSGYRIIQPVAYGKTTSGNLVIRAFQPYGDTKTKTPSWKMFRLDRIENWKPMKNKRFKEPPSTDGDILGKFNPNGDNTMSEVYLVANFHGMRNDALIKYNQKRHAEKVAADPYYDFKRNIKKAQDGNKIDYVRKNVEDWQKSAAAAEFRKGNGQSVYDMSRVHNFGDDQETQTVGPVRKGNADTAPQQQPKQMNYTAALNNGPLYKQNIQQAETDTDEYEDSQTDAENAYIEKDELNGRK